MGTELKEWASALPRPRAILVVSAMWSTPEPTRGTTVSRPASSIPYAAPGAPELAYDLSTLIPVERASNHGWDDGVVVPLVHMYPDADVPVLQLSLIDGATPKGLFAFGRKLGTLAEWGYLIMGSGELTPPAALDPNVDAAAEPSAREFDAWVANLLADGEHESLFAWRKSAPHAPRMWPVSDTLAPLFVIAGAASAAEHAVGFPIRGFSHGTVSRRCVQFGR